MKYRLVHVKGTRVEVRGRFARLCSASIAWVLGIARDFSLLARPSFELLIPWPQALSAGIIGLHQYLSLTFSAPLRVNFQGNLCSIGTSDFEESHTGCFVRLFGFLLLLFAFCVPSWSQLRFLFL